MGLGALITKLSNPGVSLPDPKTLLFKWHDYDAVCEHEVVKLQWFDVARDLKRFKMLWRSKVLLSYVIIASGSMGSCDTLVQKQVQHVFTQTWKQRAVWMAA